MLTRFEKTRLLSARALQISLGAPALVKVEKDETPLQVARKEFDEKIMPLSVIRTYPNGDMEKVSVW